MTADPLLLGIDLGTSSLKCGVFDLGGNCAGFARVAYPTRELPDGAEQDCGHWYSALTQGVRLATRSVDRQRIAGIGVGGHAPSPAIVDAHLQALGPVLPWFDGRSAPARGRLLQGLGAGTPSGAERLTAQLAARALWLQSTSRGQFAYARSILHSGDYLIARLTGRRITSSPNVPTIFTAADLPAALLPERECQPGEIVDRLSGDAADQLGLLPEVVVVAGGLDSFLASIGSGMQRSGDACLNLGSSAVVALLARPGVVGRFQWAGLPLVSRPISPDGRSLQWTERMAGQGAPSDELLAQAARLSPPAANGQGNALIRSRRTSEIEVRQQISALGREHSTVELLRLLLDAIFESQRSVLDELEGDGQPVLRIRSVGRIATSPLVNQLQADLVGRPIEIPSITDSGSLGGAMLAAMALGHFTAAEAAAKMVRPGQTVHPRAGFASDAVASVPSGAVSP